MANANTAYSDEEKYANESFENDSDNEIPENSETESGNENQNENKNESEFESDIETAPTESNASLLYNAYARKTFQSSSSFQDNDHVPYDSSSDDDNDVIISETIAEINTKPMMEFDEVLADKISSMQVSYEEALNHDDEVEQVIVSEMSDDSESVEEFENQSETESDEENLNLNLNEQHEIDHENDEESKNYVIETTRSQQYSNGNAIDKYEMYEADLLSVSEMLQTEIEVEKLTETTAFTQNAKSQINVDINIDIPQHVSDMSPTAVEKNAKTSDDTNQETNTVLSLDTANITETESETDAEVEVRISSQTPTSFNSDDYAFHMNFVKPATSNEKFRLKGAQRKSWSFSNERMREIERDNHILLRKILTQKPTYVLNEQKYNVQNNKSATSTSMTRITSAAINRKKKQRQIDLDNQVLKRKIEAISLRRPIL